uniref:Uncharacterized protein n=1 Tax=Arundo donax TaxID=35708 RepID=A0A0A9DLK2_ARUDO
MSSGDGVSNLKGTPDSTSQVLLKYRDRSRSTPHSSQEV